MQILRSPGRVAGLALAALILILSMARTDSARSYRQPRSVLVIAD